MGSSVVDNVLGGVVGGFQIGAARDKREATKRQYQLGLQRQSEERAANASEAALERRRQIREERIKRARIIQASENTGVEGSSGELGAIGSLATNLSANIGTNLGRLASSERISGINQGIADAQFSFQKASLREQNAQMVTNFGKSIFGT